MRSHHAGLLLLALSQLVACGDRVEGWPIADLTAPTVVATVPRAEASAVPPDAPLFITFSTDMAPATISTTTVTLSAGATAVPGAVTLSGAAALFDPTGSLAPNTVYTATVTRGAKNLHGIPLAADYVWTFTTGAQQDTTAPQVIWTVPLDSAIDVSLNAGLTATFSEVMDPASVTAATFTLAAGAAAIPSTIHYIGVTALLVPDGGLAPETTYTATITTGAMNPAGNHLAAPYVWTFKTGLTPDTTRPHVTLTVPADDASDVSATQDITATFDEAMDPTTLTTASFTLQQLGLPIAGTVTYTALTATFHPNSPLDLDTIFAATVSTEATDLAGNSLAVNYVWNFHTGLAPDLTRPTVTATVPAMDATDVALNAAVTATFSEAMDPATLSATTFQLAHGGTAVTGVVSYVGVTAMLVPSGALDPNALYTATITAAAADLAGNTLAAPYVWTFTTGPTPDTTRPRVTLTVPADDAKNVSVSQDVVAIFSEPMDALTINTANFTVQQGDVRVAGTVTYTNLSGTFHPNSPLAANTTFAATVTTGASDLAGNFISVNFVWNFTTSAVPDTTRPEVILVVPADGDIGVTLDTSLLATFSEVMDPLSLTTATFTLRHGVVAVLGTVQSFGNIAGFNPSAALLPGTLYTATITLAARDLAGNTLAQDFVWQFTTGVLVDDQPPSVILMNPANLASNVPLNAAVNATFSEEMDAPTVTTATYTLADPNGLEVLGTVVYDPTTRIATFTPLADLLADTTYTATVSQLVTDLAGNPMLADAVWTFTTALVTVTPPIIDLGSLVSFVAVAGAGLTNSNSSGQTVLNGDVGLSPTGTCIGDGSPCTLLNPVINGTLYANDPGGIATKAKIDLTAAYVQAMAMPIGTTVNDISGMVLAPGVYTSDSTMSIAVGGQVTLDGQGDANAFWVFQIGSSLTVNNNAQIILINGAKAKNVFWAAFASSTLGSNVSFVGTVMAGASNSVGTDSTVVGRLLCMTGAITLLSNTITLPPL